MNYNTQHISIHYMRNNKLLKSYNLHYISYINYYILIHNSQILN
jgi:hypothetical protein